MNTITRCTIFSQDGVYVPHIYGQVVIYRRDRTGDPLFGVEVGSVSNARLFADVYVISNGQLVDFVPQLKKEVG